MMKKLLSVLLLVLLLTLTVACSDGQSTTAVTTAVTTAGTTAVTTVTTADGTTTVPITTAPITMLPIVTATATVPITTMAPTPVTTAAPVTTVVETTEVKEELIPVFDAYDLDTYMTPIWEGNTVYQESVMFVGKDDAAPLLYTPTEILSVRSCDLKTEYREGVDYRLENGKLVLCENSRIPVMAVEEYYPKTQNAYGCFGSNLGADRPFVRWGEEDTFFRYQVFVSYRHDEAYTGFVPVGQSSLFPNTLKKLENGEEVKIVFYGDSITEGYNTSGFIGKAPYAARYSEMVAETLAKRFDNQSVICLNTALAGKDTVWAEQNLASRVLDHSPDLVVLAFGMNDGGSAAMTVANRLVTMADTIMKTCEGCEVLIVSTMLPNKEAAGFWGNQQQFETGLRMEIKRQKLSVGLVQMTSLHASLLQIKPYYHLTGNNINHPNDFLARFYAQSIVKAITEKE